MYRYSRGQSGQGSLPRPAWGASGAHGTRAASPEPGGLTSGGGGSDAPKERQDEVILMLENELIELRNACAWKDQRIAELSRTDTPAARLKRDIRQLATELHVTRKHLSESIGEVQELSDRLQRCETREVAGAESPSSAATAAGVAGTANQQVGGSSAASRDRTGSNADRGAQLRERISELTDENRQLRDTVMQLKEQAASRQNSMSATQAEDFDNVHHGGRQPSGASTQRVSEPPQPHPATVSAVLQSGYPPTNSLRVPYHSSAQVSSQQQTGVSAQTAPSSTTVSTTAPQPEEPIRQIVYSSANSENAATIGPTMLQGVGTVDGVASVAKVLLQRIHCSVCSAHRRNPGAVLVGML